MTEIGRLTDVPPRDAWRDEARNFTPWLADHLDHLGEVIGLRLEYEDSEVSVEAFSADIIARNPTNDTRVLIENQLERSDHRHLGQIMTYLAGLDAQVIVWLATAFTEPHLAAIKWLNEHTVEPFAFFAIRLRVVQIGDSLPAPIFEVLERPNNWERQMQAATREKQSRSRRAEDRTAFWSMFIARYPDFGARGMVANGASSQWLAPDRANGLVISVYMALTDVGLFLRGTRGITAGEIAERFEPVRDQFAALVDGEVSGGSSEGHPVCVFSTDMTKRENWGAAIDWLHSKATLWLSATDAVFGEDAT